MEVFEIFMDKKFEFSLSLLFFWVKGNLAIDNNFIKVSTANAIFGLFPAGKDSQNIPLKNISSTQLSSKYSIFRMIIGIIFILVSLSKLGTSFFSALIFLLIGLIIFGSGILTRLTIQKAGRDFTIVVPFYEKGKMLQIQDYMEDALVNDVNKTDLNNFFEQKNKE
jgi:hypothetical protein